LKDTDEHDGITFHRLRFPERVSAHTRAFPQVVGPDCWMFGPHYDVATDGMLTGASDIWGGVDIWLSQDAAEVMIAAPGEHMPWLGETVAAWHCLSVPTHCGSVTSFTRLRAVQSCGDWDGEVASRSDHSL